MVSSSTKSGTPSVRATTASSSSGGSAASCRHAPRHLLHVLPAEPRQGDPGVMRAQRPRRAELRPGGVDQQQPSRGALLDQQLGELERRGVHPVQVVEHDHHGLRARDAEHPADQGREKLPALLLRRGDESRVALRHGNSEQRSDQRHGLGGLLPRQRERGFERREPLLRRRVRESPEALLEHLGDGVGRACAGRRASPRTRSSCRSRRPGSRGAAAPGATSRSPASPEITTTCPSPCCACSKRRRSSCRSSSRPTKGVSPRCAAAARRPRTPLGPAIW